MLFRCPRLRVAATGAARLRAHRRGLIPASPHVLMSSSNPGHNQDGDETYPKLQVRGSAGFPEFIEAWSPTVFKQAGVGLSLGAAGMWAYYGAATAAPWVGTALVAG